jgi:hypothetical protein
MVARLPITSICLAGAVAVAGLGYPLVAGRWKSPLILARQRAQLEYFFCPRSFSEVENARTLLEALSKRSLTELRERRYAAGLLPHSTNRHGQNVARQPRLAEAINALEKAIGEFQGTDGELDLVKDLLMLLKGQELHDQWLDLYLHTLYEHPTHQLLGALAQDAIRMGEAACRKDEVRKALRHLTSIPFPFAAKAQIEAFLAGNRNEDIQR